MQIAWTDKAQSDLARLYAFLAPASPRAAAGVVQKIIAGTQMLGEQPRIGAPLSEFAPRDVRRLIVGDYEIRYEIAGNLAYIVRLWHTREDR